MRSSSPPPSDRPPSWGAALLALSASARAKLGTAAALGPPAALESDSAADRDSDLMQTTPPEPSVLRLPPDLLSCE